MQTPDGRLPRALCGPGQVTQPQGASAPSCVHWGSNSHSCKTGVGKGSVTLVQLLAPWNSQHQLQALRGADMAPSHPKGPGEIPQKVSICHNRNSWRGGPAKGRVHRSRAGTERYCLCPCPSPYLRAAPGTVSPALILSGWWGPQLDPGAAPPPRWAWSPVWVGPPPIPPHPRPRGHRGPLWVPRSPADGRGGRAMTGHLGTGAAGRRVGRLRPPSSHPRAPRGYGRWPLGARRARGSATPEGAHPSPGSPNAGPGGGCRGGRRAGGTPAPRLLGTLCGEPWGQPRIWRN